MGQVLEPVGRCHFVLAGGVCLFLLLVLHVFCLLLLLLLLFVHLILL